MCGGVEFEWHNEKVRTFFPNPNAKLPVIRKDGELELVSWGRRNDENTPDAEGFPVNGWARYETFLNPESSWRKFRHKEVKIAVPLFMEKDENGKSHWFRLEKNEYIRGLLLIINGRWRVYVLTTEPPEVATPYLESHQGMTDLFGELNTTPAKIHHRWPLTGSLENKERAY